MTSAIGPDYQKAYIEQDLHQLNVAFNLVKGVFKKNLSEPDLDEVNNKLKELLVHNPLGHNVLKHEIEKLQLHIVQLKASIDDPKGQKELISEIFNDFITASTIKEKLIGELQSEVLSLKEKEANVKKDEDTKTAATGTVEVVKNKPSLSPELKNHAIKAYKRALADPQQRGVWPALLQLAQFYLIENRVPEINYDFTAHNTLHPIIDSWGKGGDMVDITINLAENSREEMVIDYEEVGNVPRSKVEEWAKNMLAVEGDVIAKLAAKKDKFNPNPTVEYEDFGKLKENPADLLRVKDGVGSKGKFLIHDSVDPGLKTLSYCTLEEGLFKQEDLMYDPDDEQFLVKQIGEKDAFNTLCSTIGEYIASHANLNPKGGLTRKELGL